MRVLILATDIYTRGGIARYTATLAAAPGQSLGPASVDVLPLFDDPGRRFTPPEYRILKATTTKLGLRHKIRHVVRAFGCAKARYDLVFCSHVGLAPIAALIRGWNGTPYSVVCYGSEVWDRLPFLNRAALQGAALVLADSQFTANVVAETNGVPKRKIALLLNAIPEDLVRRLVGPDPDRASDSPESAQRPLSHPPHRVPLLPRGEGSYLPTVGPLMLSVGSLKTEHAYKGVDTVIEALPSIIDAVPGVRYLVVGDGDNRPNLERLAAARGISERVTFAGELTDADLAEHYRACDVFVLPSRASLREGSRPGTAEGEGFGRVYVEAALAGKAVVGSRDGGAAEAVLDGQTGLLVNPRSPEEIATAVIALLATPDRAAAMGAQGRRWALENFTMTAMRTQVEAVLASAFSSQSSVLSSRRSRPTAVLTTDD